MMKVRHYCCVLKQKRKKILHCHKNIGWLIIFIDVASYIMEVIHVLNELWIKNYSKYLFIFCNWIWILRLRWKWNISHILITSEHRNIHEILLVGYFISDNLRLEEFHISWRHIHSRLCKMLSCEICKNLFVDFENVNIMYCVPKAWYFRQKFLFSVLSVRRKCKI